MAASRQRLVFLAMVVAGKFNSTDPLCKPSVINPPSLAFATVNLTPLQKPGKVAKVLPSPLPILTMRSLFSQRCGLSANRRTLRMPDQGGSDELYVGRDADFFFACRPSHRSSLMKGWWLGLSLLLMVGCQTWEGGMTLPSPHYLKDSPDYIPRKSPFDLPNELREMQRNAAPAVGGSPTP
jgi:hypothetical protein